MKDPKASTTPKGKRLVIDLNALPEGPTEVRCPLCGHKGNTKVSKNMKDRFKLLIFWVIITIVIVTLFIFVLIYLFLYLVIIARNGRSGGSGCCDSETCGCKSCYHAFARCAPRVPSIHYCGKCKKAIG